MKKQNHETVGAVHTMHSTKTLETIYSAESIKSKSILLFISFVQKIKLNIIKKHIEPSFTCVILI